MTTASPFPTMDNEYFSRNKVLFLYPEVASAASFSLANKHLGASYIRAYLKTRGIPTHQHIEPQPASLGTVTENILNQQPAFLCVTVYDCTYHTVKMLVREVKNRSPEIKVLLGGPTPTFSDTVIMEDFPEADICVRGEGEHTVFELFDAIRSGRDFKQIHGLTLRHPETGALIKTPDRALIKGECNGGELDILPSPYLEGIISPSEGRQIGIITSRGCVFKCVYCNFAAMSRWSVRYHSIERVMAELEYIARHHDNRSPASITIQDDAFTLNKERAKEICRRIIAGSYRFTIDGETRADAVDAELLQLMRQSGFRDLHFGVESGSPKVLRTIKKATSHPTSADSLEPEYTFLENIRAGVTEAVRLGLKPTVSIILGLPGESLQEGTESRAFISSLPDCRYYHNYLEIFAGTELFDTHARYGIGLEQVYPHAVSRLYRTRPAYDLSKVPVLTERSLFNSGEQARAVAARMCGENTHAVSAVGTQHPSMVIFTNATFPNQLAADWFLAHAGNDTRLAMLWEGANATENTSQPNLYEIYMPLQMLYWQRKRLPDADEQQLYEDAFTHNSENLIPYHFRFLTTRHCRYGIASHPEDDVDTQYIIQPESNGGKSDTHDLRTMLHLFNLKSRTRDMNITCLDICRWSTAACPAVCMDRVVIDGNRDVYPCFTGRPLGTIDEPIEAIKQRAAVLAAKVRAVRGCDRCTAAHACSKCLFPYPMDAATFCRTMQSMTAGNPNIDYTLYSPGAPERAMPGSPINV